jgi:hypothetical protein
MNRFAEILVGMLFSASAFAHGPASSTDIALQLLDRLDARDYAAVEAGFSEKMAAAVPADKLAAVWESLPSQAGEPQGRGAPVLTAQDGVDLVVVPLHYAKAELVAKVAIDDAGRVIGFLVQPAPPPAAAPVAADAGFVERDFSVGEGPRALPGTLAMPDTGNPPAQGWPAVVLVHGSGA